MNMALNPPGAMNMAPKLLGATNMDIVYIQKRTLSPLGPDGPGGPMSPYNN